MSASGNSGRAAPLRWNDAFAVPPPSAHQENEPLLQPVSMPAVGKFIAAIGIFLLVISWCVLDNWNEMVSGALFKIGVTDETTDSHGKPKVRYFKYPLTLTFFEFLFSFFAFSALWYGTSKNRTREMRQVKAQIYSTPWPIIVVSHIFGTFWMQALMMPAQVMSISLFAATRALEVPLVATVRSLALQQPYGGHSARILGCVTAANMLLFYSYLQMEGCMCIWEGHGVFLSGAALYAIYFLLLAMPAINTVGQETLMTVWNMNPFLMLALQNGFACIIFFPAHLVEGTQAFRMIYHYQEVSLLVLWLCIQGFAFALVTVLLVRCLDSFWAVSLRSMRVVYWWCWQLIIFYLGSNSLLSVAQPKISGWSFGMMSGLAVLAYAMYSDSSRFDQGSLKKDGADADGFDQDETP